MRRQAILIALGVVGIGCGESLGESSSALQVVEGTTGATTSGGGTGTGSAGTSTGGTTTGASTGATTGGDPMLPCCTGTATNDGLTNGGSWSPDPGQDPGVNCSCVDTCQSACSWGTPLVLSLLDSPVEFTEASGYFDLSGGSEPRPTDWVSARTPWLCLDRDGDGRVDDGRELFGSMTRLGNGHRAANGFEALAELDGDGDGFLTSADPAWGDLLVWSDRNQDRVAQPGELLPLRATPIRAIALTYRSIPRCDVRGNCEIERADVYYDETDHTAVGAMVDVHLPSRPATAQARRQHR